VEHKSVRAAPKPDALPGQPLFQSERWWNSLFEHVPEYIYVINPDGRLLYFNRTLPTETPERVLGTSLYDWLPAPVAVAMRQAVADVIRTREPGLVEQPTSAHLAGRWFARRIAPVIEDDVVVALIVIATDVTDKRQAEEALREARDEMEARVRRRTADLERVVTELRHSELRLSEAQQLAHTGSWEWDQDGEQLVWSDEMYRIAGLVPGATTPTIALFLSLVHPDDRDRTERAVATLRRDGGPIDLEFRIVRPGGGVRVIHSHGALVRLRGSTGRRVLGVAQDVTEIRQADQAVRREKAFVEVLEAVAVAANQARVVEDALRASLEQVCALTGWPVGHALLVQGDGRLSSSGVWELHDPDRFAELRRVSESLNYGDTAGAPALVLERGTPVWLRELPLNIDFRRAGAAQDAGLHAAVAFPVWVGREIAAVLEFFTTEDAVPDPALLQVMTHLGTQLGRVLERRRAEERLASSEAQLRELAARLVSVREEERKHMARELHDELGQSLTALKIDLRTLQRRLPNPVDLPARLDAMLGLVDGTIAATQRLATELRPGILDDLGLVPAIQWQVEEFGRRTGVPATLRIDGAPVPLDDRIATAAFRVLQESLTNIARHARASAVTVTLQLDSAGLALTVHDDGVGIAPTRRDDPHALGLLGMRERAMRWGGQFTIEPRDGGGTTVRLRVPLTQAPA
jgi:PAS domain S-box-containing protein